MTVDVETGGRTRHVQVTPAPGGWEVHVDGRRRTVDAVALGRSSWSLLVGGRSYDVGLAAGTSGDLTVYVNGRMVPVTMGGRLRGRRRRADEPGAPGSDAAGPQTVAAPMPGRIVKVLVKAGDAVAARQGLVIVEAMKMENELRAARAGVVREVRVVEGAPVEAHAVLVVIE